MDSIFFNSNSWLIILCFFICLGISFYAYFKTKQNKISHFEKTNFLLNFIAIEKEKKISIENSNQINRKIKIINQQVQLLDLISQSY